jgi:hypothetical protein
MSEKEGIDKEQDEEGGSDHKIPRPPSPGPIDPPKPPHHRPVA